MYPNQSPNPYSYPQSPPPVARSAMAEALPYIRKVYSLFTGGVGFAILGAYVALNVGQGEPIPGTDTMLPPVVAFAIRNWWVMFIGYIGATFAASMLRKKPVVNLVALFGYTFLTGLFIAPLIFVAQFKASQGATLSSSPVLHAFLLTGAAFTGLTAYVFISRKNFSFLGAALNMGFWIILGALILNMFFQATIFGLAIASVGVLLFSGYILYDTSRLLHDKDESDPVGAALRLFSDVVNVFIFLLRILSSSRR